MPQGTNDAELRRGTALFIDITGFTELTHRLGHETAYPLVTGLLERFDVIVERHQGSVEAHQGDAVMALFGLEPALEDAARAAVNSAIEMHAETERYNQEKESAPALRVHTGIATGEMMYDPARSRAMGDPVNTAARLKDRAPPDQIWLAEGTWYQVRRHFDLKPLGRLDLHGLGQIPAWSLESRSTAPRDRRHRGEIRADFVGREQELELLDTRIKALAEGRGGVVAITGEAGTGKSRLVAESIGRDRAGTISWITGRCENGNTARSYHLFANLVRSWIGIADDTTDVEPLEIALQRLFGSESTDHVPFLANAMGLTLAGSHAERLGEIEGEALERLTTRSAISLLRAQATEAPLGLVLDDLQWGDASSLDLLGSLLRVADEHPILFVLLSRPRFESTRLLLDEAAERTGVPWERIELDALDRRDARAIVRQLLGGGGVPRALRERIEERTQGNPFFIEEAIRSLVDKGLLVWEDGVLRARPGIGDVEIPDSVDGVIQSRLERLSRDARDLLFAASVVSTSVVGTGVDLDVLGRVAEAESIDVELGALADAQLVTRRTRRGRPQVLFSHPLIQEVAYRTVRRQRRMALHLRVARTMEAELPQQTPGRASLLAYHYLCAEEPELAEPHLLEAGDEASRKAASGEAIEHFQTSLRIYLSLHGEEARTTVVGNLERKLALAYFNRGRFMEADEHFNRALELHGDKVPTHPLHKALVVIQSVASVLLELYFPTRVARRPATEQERKITAMRLDRARAETTAAPDRFFLHALDGLRILRQFDPSTVLGVGLIYAAAGGILAFDGRFFGASARFLARARDTVRSDSPREQFFYGLMSFVHGVLSGSWAKEAELSAESIAEHRHAGEIWDVTTYLGLLQNKQSYQGRFREAEETLEVFADLDELFAFDLARQNLQFGRALLDLARMRFDSAIEHAKEYLAEHDEASFNLLALGTIAEIEVERGNFDSAKAALRDAADLAGLSNLEAPFHRNAPSRAQLRLDVAKLERAMRTGNRGDARKLRRASRRSAGRAMRNARRLAWDRPIVWRLVGTRLWLCGRRRAAKQWWLRSAAEAERLQMLPELAQIQLEIGKRLGAQGSDDVLNGASAAEWFQRGLTTARQIGLEVAKRKPGSGRLRA